MTAYDFGYAIGQALVIIIPVFVILGLVFAIRNAIRRPAEEAKRRAEEAARLQAQQQWYAAQEAQARARQQWEYEQRVAEEGRRAAAAAEEEQARARWEHEQRVAEEGRRAAAAAEEEQARAREAMARTSMEARARERRLRLIDRFGAEAAERILREELWIGETEEMVQESLGYPDDVDERVMKTKHRRVLKYRPLGKNRYGLRITLDDGEVVGWEEKGERFG